MRESFEDFVSRGRRQFGDKFDTSCLIPSFVRFFGSQERVKVKFGYGEIVTGTIGVTTGWRPVFLLLRTSRSAGSRYTIGPDDRVVAIQYRGKYIPC